MGVTDTNDPVIPDIPPVTEPLPDPNSGGSGGGGGGNGETVPTKDVTDGKLVPGRADVARPVVSFTYNAYTGRTVQFTDKTLNSPAYWRWDFGDGSISTTKNPVHAFPMAGSFKVRLTCWNSSLLYSSYYETYVTVADSAKTASFTATANAMEAVCIYTGTAFPSNIIWDFGDGTTSTELNPRHLYTTAGVYTITLFVSDLAATASFTATNAVSIFSKTDTVPNTDDIRGIKSYGGLVYVCNVTLNRVEIYDELDLSTMLASFGSAGSGNGQFSTGGPEWIDCDATHIYVTDPQAATPRVQKFDIATYAFVEKSEFPTSYPDKKIGSLYVDPVNNFVYVGYSNSGTGAYVYRSSKTAFSPTSFSLFVNINVSGYDYDAGPIVGGSTDNIFGYFIATQFAVPGAVQQLRYVAKGGAAMTTIASKGAGDGDVEDVRGICASSDGTIGYLVDNGNGLIKTFNAATPTVITDSGIEAQNDVIGLTVKGGNQSGDPSESGDYLLVFDQTDNEFRKYSLYDNPLVEAPVSSFTATPIVGVAPLTVVFTNTSTGDTLTHLWEFGDGQTSAAASPSHTYLNDGVFTVRLTETNTIDSSVSYKTITVNARQDELKIDPPIASFTASPMLGVRDPGTGLLAVSFTDTSTGTPTVWAWDFGDSSTSAAQNPSHNYSHDGIFIVTLTAEDANGFTSVAKKAIIVTATAAPSDNPPTASISASATSGTYPFSVDFTSTVNTPDVQYLWDFGDGVGSNVANPSHTFGNPGTYEVTLTVTNTWGSTSASITIIVQGVVQFSGGGYGEIGTYILDRKNHRILMYDSTGAFAGVIGEYGTAQGKFNNPTMLFVSRPTFGR